MKSTKYFIFITVAMGILGSVAFGQISQAGHGRAVERIKSGLARFEAVSVVIVEPNSAPNKDGLIWQKLQSDVEDRLERSGLEIIRRRADVNGPGKLANEPQLRVNIDVVELAYLQQSVIRIETSLSREVRVAVMKGPIVRADVWRSAAALQMVSTDATASVVSNVVSEQIGSFIKSWLSANRRMIRKLVRNNREESKEKINRTSEGPAVEYEYITSRKSKIFHKADCGPVKRILLQNITGYKSRDEAVKAGKRPCKMCKP
ncbi:MAG: hypothetical protein ACYS8Y_11480 [Planctomycetota bacterium]|jgi:hypothetical protein